jgi:asparagine synthase (glutamine-hydrolysing)
MPGIVGLITRMLPERALAELSRMLGTMQHESSYRTGTWADEAAGVYVGWTVRKNSFADGMPLGNEDNSVSLIFAGEEYPDPTTAADLKQRGHAVQPGPSYLVHIYEEDANFLAQLNGRFHGLLTDRNRGTVTLFNDRYGLHRIYYHESKEAFYFAAEAKAILEVRPELRRPNYQSIGEFISCGCVLENRSFFEGIQVLPVASAWTFRNGTLEAKASYFQPKEWEEQSQLDLESYYQQIRDVFARILPRYFDSREQIGMSLTGGLDTRMIMAWHRSPAGKLPCYSFGGTYNECQDVLVARRVAEVCGQTHQVIELGKDFLSRFPHYAERAVYLSDGCTEVNRASDLYANERAFQIAPVRMTGNYGGEVLRRIVAFRPGEPMAGLFRPELMQYIRRTPDTYKEALKCHPLSFAVFRQTAWHHYGLLALEQTQLSLRSPYLDNEFVRTVFRAPDSGLDNGVCLRLIGEGDPVLRQMRTDRGLAGTRAGLSAAVVRGYLEFTFKAEYAYDYGMPQSVAKVDHMLSALHLEKLFLGRHKFAHYRVWYRDALSNYVREMLLDSKTLARPYLDKQVVEGVVQGHLKGNRNHTTEIHKILSLELIHRLFIDAR